MCRVSDPANPCWLLRQGWVKAILKPLILKPRPSGVVFRHEADAMAEPKLAERRVTQRQRALKSATVIFDDRASTLNCVVRNYSEHDAYLKSIAQALFPRGGF